MPSRGISPFIFFNAFPVKSWPSCTCTSLTWSVARKILSRKDLRPKYSRVRSYANILKVAMEWQTMHVPVWRGFAVERKVRCHKILWNCEIFIEVETRGAEKRSPPAVAGGDQGL